jgi:hypothetical protein
MKAKSVDQKMLEWMRQLTRKLDKNPKMRLAVAQALKAMEASQPKALPQQQQNQPVNPQPLPR